MICVIDYGAGNLHSVLNALHYLDAEATVIAEAQQLATADAVILPGVGSFGDAMQKLRAAGLDQAIREYIQSDRPFLGICLGLQLLFESSDESPGIAGLGILEGTISRIPDGQLKVPHIGWNSLDICKNNGILAGMDQPYVYFVHSYYLTAKDRSIVSATTQYGVTIDAAIQRGNLEAVQFHPEKSGETGLQMLRNFITKL